MIYVSYLTRLDCYFSRLPSVTGVTTFPLAASSKSPSSALPSNFPLANKAFILGPQDFEASKFLIVML